MGNHYTEVRATLEGVKFSKVYAYLSLLLNEEEIEKFNLMSKEEQTEYLYESADLIIDTYDIDDCGEIEEIIID